MDSIVFTVDVTPKGQPRARAATANGKAWVYTPSSAAPYKLAVKAEAAKHRPEKPIEGPVCADITFTFPRPKSHYRKDGTLKEGAPVFHTKKPDRDNCDKAVLDAITQVGGFWNDDAQVCDGRLLKVYGSSPQLLIIISKL